MIELIYRESAIILRELYIVNKKIKAVHSKIKREGQLTFLIKRRKKLCVKQRRLAEERNRTMLVEWLEGGAIKDIAKKNSLTQMTVGTIMKSYCKQCAESELKPF